MSRMRQPNPTGQNRAISLRHVPLSLLASLVVLTAVAWAVTLYHAWEMRAPMGIALRAGMADEGMAGMAMAGIPAAGWSVIGAGVFVALWTVMMTAMMLPAAAPMLLMFAAAQSRRTRKVAVPTWTFATGYLLVWAGVGVLVYGLVQIGSDVAARLDAPARAIWAPRALAATLVAAGLYQFTPLKHMCLARCRSPFGFVAQYWRDGRLGALGMGIRHGLFCLGCCWAIFAVLVATGVMSVAWMLLLTLVVFAEKVMPHGRRSSAAVGAALLALGLLVATGAISMPWMA